MTWLLVTMWPSSSHTKPEPVPCGMVKMLRENRSSTRAVVEMYTTEPFERSNSSMVAFSSAARSPRAAIGRGCVQRGLPQPERRLPGEKAADDDHRKQAHEPSTGEHGVKLIPGCRRARRARSLARACG